MPTQPAYVINTYSYTSRLTAFACLEHLSDLGFNAFEMMLIPGHFWPSLASLQERKAIENLLITRGLKVATINQPNMDVNLAALSPECLDYSCAVVGSALELAADWGAMGVVINPGKANPVFSPGQSVLSDRFRSSLDVLVPRAEKLGVKLLVKNHPLSWIYRGDDLLAFFDSYGWSQIGLGYDVANATFGREDAVDTLPRVLRRMAAIYGADTSLDEFRHDPAGAGAVPFAQLAEVLRGVGYAGPTILEIVASDPDTAIMQTISHLEHASWPSRPA